MDNVSWCICPLLLSNHCQAGPLSWPHLPASVWCLHEWPAGSHIAQGALGCGSSPGVQGPRHWWGSYPTPVPSASCGHKYYCWGAGFHRLWWAHSGTGSETEQVQRSLTARLRPSEGKDPAVTAIVVWKWTLVPSVTVGRQIAVGILDNSAMHEYINPNCKRGSNLQIHSPLPLCTSSAFSQEITQQKYPHHVASPSVILDLPDWGISVHYVPSLPCCSTKWIKALVKQSSQTASALWS